MSVNKSSFNASSSDNVGCVPFLVLFRLRSCNSSNLDEEVEDVVVDINVEDDPAGGSIPFDAVVVGAAAAVVDIVVVVVEGGREVDAVIPPQKKEGFDKQKNGRAQISKTLSSACVDSTVGCRRRRRWKI